MIDFITRYTKMANTTEVPEYLYMWSAISGVAAILSRNVKLQFGDSFIYPNLYIMFIGSPGSKKSSAIKFVKKRLRDVGYNTFCPQRVTMQKYLCDLAGVSETGDSNSLTGMTEDRMETWGIDVKDTLPPWIDSYIANDEFSEFIGVNNFDFVVLLGSFWDADAPYEYRTRHGRPVLTPTPNVNILGGTTPGQFATIFPSKIAETGFLSRLIMVGAETSNKKFEIPEPSPVSEIEWCNKHLQNIMDLKGTAYLTDCARKFYKEIYLKREKISDPRFSYYESRRGVQCLKIAMILAACKLSLEIKEREILEANTILSYAESKMPDVLGAFGKQIDADVNDKIINFLVGLNRPASQQEIYKAVCNDIKVLQLPGLLNSLRMADKIACIQNVGWIPVKTEINENMNFVDWEILKGII